MYDAGLAAGVATARLLLQDGAVEADPDSSQSLLQDMGAVASPIRGAPAQLTLPAAQVPQPMYHADITPRYLFDPAVPPRVRSLLPEARIVAILRGELATAHMHDHASKAQGSLMVSGAATERLVLALLKAGNISAGFGVRPLQLCWPPLPHLCPTFAPSK